MLKFSAILLCLTGCVALIEIVSADYHPNSSKFEQRPRAQQHHIYSRSYNNAVPNRWTNRLNYWSSQPYRARRVQYGQVPSRMTMSRRGLSSRWPSPKSARTTSPGMQMDNKGRVQMGVANSMCDDGKKNLTMDWNMSPVNHTCYHPEKRFPLDLSLPSIEHCDRLPPRYVPGHVCMDQKISYDDDIPTHGDHRPLWPMFGEYIFVPRERWLHNIEHGAVVMLYHPCAHPAEVNKLRNIVRNCVGKHVITPSTFVPPERPLALVAWGCRLQMAVVDEDAAISFIHRKAMRGPEGSYTKEGQYTYGLLKLATMSGNGAKYGYSKVQCVS